jgi:hypothetical protein
LIAVSPAACVSARSSRSVRNLASRQIGCRASAKWRRAAHKLFRRSPAGHPAAACASFPRSLARRAQREADHAHCDDTVERHPRTAVARLAQCGTSVLARCAIVRPRSARHPYRALSRWRRAEPGPTQTRPPPTSSRCLPVGARIASRSRCSSPSVIRPSCFDRHRLASALGG